MPARILLRLLLAASAMLAAPAAMAALGPAGHGAFVRPLEPAGPAAAPAPVVPPTRSAATALYPQYEWPMEHALHDGLWIVNYVDHDATAGIADHMNGDWTYDGHRGTDIALQDFRAMDRGMRIRSAAAGTVAAVVYANARDRNCAAPDNPTLNYVQVANGDGTLTSYYHLRANSATVDVGETVQAGQVLGMAGSSGFSTGPHLHFEPGDFLSGPYQHRDPWPGPMNPFPGLWFNPEPYEGTQPIRLSDLGVTTETAVGGSIGAPDYCGKVMEHLQQPAVLGVHEPFLPVWISLQGVVGDFYRIEVWRPNQTLYGSVDHWLEADVRGGFHYWYWYWDTFVSGFDYGTWTVKLISGGVTRRQTTFTVGPATVFGPRLVRSGRSFRIDGAVHRDTLQVTPLGGPVTYALLGAPAFVSLAGNVVTVGAASTQPTRSLYFKVVATDGAARRDTAFYHVVDPSKPHESLVAVDAAAPEPGLRLAPASPNPFGGRTVFRFALARTGRVTVALYDLAGRRVRTLVDGARQPVAGGEAVAWDGRDDAGRALPAGVYLCRLEAGGERRTQRVVRLP